MKKIPLTQGKCALVDDADFDWLNKWKWRAQKKENGNFYSVRTIRVDQKKKLIYMHRLILGLDFGDKRQGDHINRTTLDNRRSNLRIATNAQNQHNSGKKVTNTSGFKGVRWHKKNKKWHAEIRINGKYKHLGLFKNPEDAARSYDMAARELHGEFARTNG